MKKKEKGITINKRKFKSLEEFSQFGRGCATPRPNHYQIARADEQERSARVNLRQIQKIEINVQFTHITFGQKGKITEKQREKQIDVLNTAFSKAGVIFHYNPYTVKFYEEKTWYNMDHGSVEEREAKTYLHVTPERNLNFYTAGIASPLLGWATFPYELDGDRIRDGVVMLDESLPGGNAAPFNLGITAVHEIGHWLGLYHTFQGGCIGFGDQIDDTVSHKEPNSGKPLDGEPHGACKIGEFAPIHNYMNYCDDDWLNEFSAEQINRIKKQVATYRKGFIVQ